MTELVEQWRPIEGYDELYEVSNMGKVRSLDRIDRLGRLKPGRILRPGMDGVGYLKVGLCKEGKVKTLLVHRLVAQAFIPNPNNLPQINHKDEDKTNNVVFLNDDGSVDECRSNLEWCDRKYNNNYGTKNERMVQTRIRNGTYDPEMCGMTRKEYHRLYYQKNLDYLQEQNKDYYQKKREKKLEYQREYYQKKREKKLEYDREYRRRKKQRQTT